MLKFHQALSDGFDDFKETSDTTSEAAYGFIKVEYEDVTFTFQSGNVEEFGINGIQCEEVLQYVKSYLNILNSHLPSDHNVAAINHITKAIKALNNRTADRVMRGVEGTHNE